jgi:arsenate reductase (thioredoxin)
MTQAVDFIALKPPYGVLFLCTGNSARSIMGEVILNRLGRGAFRGYSAGSHPRGQVHLYALDLLRKLDFDVSGVRSKSWSEFAKPDAPKLDLIFTVCDAAANEACPVWPGHPMTVHWGIPDPAAVEGTEAKCRVAFAEAFQRLNNRIDALVNLPISALNWLTLRGELEMIGRSKAAADRPAAAAP